jgi:tetratricopeptide (TPR) repeat protein
MQHRIIQIVGILWTIVLATAVVWLYFTEPKTLHEVATNTTVAAGTYQIDQVKWDSALDLFRREQYRAARDEWGRADPAMKDAKTQFYIAYAFYREGWGRAYDDDAMYQEGIKAVDRALALAPNGVLDVPDSDLGIHSPAELKAELQDGTERSLSDLNPMKIFRTRK